MKPAVRRLRPARGFSMLMAMLIVVVSTLLVLGAISFTGTERIAAAQHQNYAVMSACVQNARNLILSRARILRVGEDIRSLDPSNPNVVHNAARALDAGFPVDPARPNELVFARVSHYANSEPMTFDGGTVTSIDVIRDGLMQVQQRAEEKTNVVGRRNMSQGVFYNVHVMCAADDAGLQEQELEFVVRLGI